MDDLKVTPEIIARSIREDEYVTELKLVASKLAATEATLTYLKLERGRLFSELRELGYTWNACCELGNCTTSVMDREMQNYKLSSLGLS